MKHKVWLISAAIFVAGYTSTYGFESHPGTKRVECIPNNFPAVSVGQRGKDWACRTVSLRGNGAMRIVAKNGTTPVDKGNTAGLQLWVNDKVVVQESVGSAHIEKEYEISGTGAYRVELLCTNLHANSNVCDLQFDQVDTLKANQRK